MSLFIKLGHGLVICVVFNVIIDLCHEITLIVAIKLNIKVCFKV